MVGNRQTMHNLVQMLEKMLFHTLIATKAQKTIEISWIEILGTKGGGKKGPKKFLKMTRP